MVDYTKPCEAVGSCVCQFRFERCAMVSDNCGTACPSPLDNSHLVSNNCSIYADCYSPNPFICQCRCEGLSGDCSYDCDAGYEWNGVACVLIPAEVSGSARAFPYVELMGIVACLFKKVRDRYKKIVSSLG